MSVRTYEKAGVPNLKGDIRYNKKISKLVSKTRIPGVLGSSTGFASLFDVKKCGLRDPLLVSSTDGVGTKLEIARLQGCHHTIGIDLVAMCVNDILTCGAKPILFLDYYASGKFDSRVTEQVLRGVAAGCREARCALVGGETAIMPGFYHVPKNGDVQYDLAGFAVGVVERHQVIDGSKMRQGDVLLGIASSGFHSNGFSLLRKIFSEKDLKGKIGKMLLTPTRIYVRSVERILESISVKGIAHITGGGLKENLNRIIPVGLGAQIRLDAWPQPKLFSFVKDYGSISNSEMAKTFNLGIGLVLVLRGSDLSKVCNTLKRMKLPSWPIGEIVRGKGVNIQ